MPACRAFSTSPHPVIQNPSIVRCVSPAFQPRGQTSVNTLCFHSWLLPMSNPFHTLISVIFYINYSGPSSQWLKTHHISALLYSTSIKRLEMKWSRGMADQMIKGFMRHHIHCKRFMLAIQSGDWYKYVMTPHSVVIIWDFGPWRYRMTKEWVLAGTVPLH